MSTQNNGKVGVLLMTYGSATTAGRVAEYLGRIYKGKASESLIQDFENRYKLVGRSPLIEITEKQAVLLQKSLGNNYVVRVGMRHSVPFIEGAVVDCHAAGVSSLVGIILSPQFSSFIMEEYKTVFTQAAVRHGLSGHSTVVGPWGIEPHFVELLSNRVRESLTRLNKKYRASVPVIFTTHSLPKRVVEKDPSYLQQLQDTINAVCEKLGQDFEWYAGYQSAGHTPEEWLKPDLLDILANLHKKKTPAVLIVPIQFLADHLEILYDLDIAARKQCEEYGIRYYRIELPNTDPLFISALTSIVEDTTRQK